MLKVRLYPYVTLLWGSAFSGFNTAFFAFLALAPSDALLYRLRNGAFFADGLVYQTALLIVFAFLYATAFNVGFFFVRLLAAALSHLERFLPRITPGLAVFTLIGQPALLLVDAPVPQLAGFETPLKLALLFALSFGLGALLIYFIPVFEGYNSVFALVAALLARLVHSNLSPIDDGHTNLIYFLIFEIHLFATAFLFFIVIQARYRLHLSPNYERIEIPNAFFFPAIALCVLLWLALLVASASALEWFGSAAGSLDPSRPFLARRSAGAANFEFPLALYFLCAVHWTAIGFSLRRQRLITLERQNRLVRNSMFQAAGFLFALLISFLYVLLNPFAPQALGRVTTAGGAASEIISAAGALLDGDRDGNSAWPGADPDDENPCVRADLEGRCTIEENASAPAPRRVEGATRSSGALSRELSARGNLTLVTLTGVLPPQAWPQDATTGRPQVFSIALATDRGEHSLRAILQGLDGVDEFRGVRNPSLIAELSRIGYRTICTGVDRGRAYFDTRHNLRLDAGCQIFETPNLEEEPEREGLTVGADQPDIVSPRALADVTLAETTRRALALYDSYKEKNNFLWMHYNGSADEREVVRALEDLQAPGPLAVVFIPQYNSLRGELWLFSERNAPAEISNPDVAQTLYFAAGLRNSAPQTRARDVGALYDQTFALSWIGRIISAHDPSYPIFPMFTFRLERNQIVVFDGLTGARHQAGVPTETGANSDGLGDGGEIRGLE